MDWFSGNLVCASLFTGVFDVNRSEMLSDDNFQLIKKWCESIQKLGLKGVVFHNNFSEKTISEVQLECINFIKVDFNVRLNANVYRYLVYLDFLKEHGSQIKNLFFTDIADVEVVKSPFDELIFSSHPNSLFCGDEEKTVNNPWMRDHCTHLRNLVPEFIDFEEINGSKILLNCGVIGGKTAVMVELLEKLCEIHLTYTVSNKTPFTLDMGAFNYVARTSFSDRIIHGFPVTTRFKYYEDYREDCWFRHK